METDSVAKGKWCTLQGLPQQRRVYVSEVCKVTPFGDFSSNFRPYCIPQPVVEICRRELEDVVNLALFVFPACPAMQPPSKVSGCFPQHIHQRAQFASGRSRLCH
eukprot:2859620-Amphidinium_carterae.2